MAGARKRCVYCCDSRSSDIDHFKPVKLDHLSAFHWRNFILICPECNRCKGSKFAHGSDGKPLLIDPTSVDPWDHLILDIDSGVMAPRFHGGDYDPRGEYTLDVISPVNDEATTEGRRRAAERYLEFASLAMMEGDKPETRRTLAKVVNYDEFGLASWFAFREGRDSSEFPSMRNSHPGLWRRFCALACRQALGTLDRRS